MARWQTRLDLDSWQIKIKYIKPWKMDEDCAARSEIEPYHQKALIEITDPKFHNKDEVGYETVEHLILHELLHVRLFPDGIKDPSDGDKEDTAAFLAIEQGINFLTRLLLGSEG